MIEPFDIWKWCGRYCFVAFSFLLALFNLVEGQRVAMRQLKAVVMSVANVSFTDTQLAATVILISVESNCAIFAQRSLIARAL